MLVMNMSCLSQHVYLSSSVSVFICLSLDMSMYLSRFIFSISNCRAPLYCLLKVFIHQSCVLTLVRIVSNIGYGVREDMTRVGGSSFNATCMELCLDFNTSVFSLMQECNSVTQSLETE